MTKMCDEVKKVKLNDDSFADEDYWRRRSYKWDFFDNDDEIKSLDSKNVPLQFLQIIGLMAEDCDYNLTECYARDGCLRIGGACETPEGDRINKLVLRYADFERRMTLADIEFCHTHQGKMTELCRLLRLMKKQYGYREICIESVLTQEMESWCRKNGFHETDYPGEGLNFVDR